MPARDVVLGPIRMPRAIAGLIGATLAVSILGVMLARAGIVAPLEAVPLVPGAVLRGQLWRLVTWPFLEGEPIGLLFACLMLYWIGRDLVYAWGERAFLLRFAAIAAGAGALTTALSFLLPGVSHGAYAGTWAVLDGLIVAWGLLHRGRTIHLYGIVPVTGIQIVWLTFGLLGLYVVFRGFASFLPHIIASLGVLGWLQVYAPWRARTRRARTRQAARGEAWSFNDWYDKQTRN